MLYCLFIAWIFPRCYYDCRFSFVLSSLELGHVQPCWTLRIRWKHLSPPTSEFIFKLRNCLCIFASNTPVKLGSELPGKAGGQNTSYFIPKLFGAFLVSKDWRISPRTLVKFKHCTGSVFLKHDFELIKHVKKLSSIVLELWPDPKLSKKSDPELRKVRMSYDRQCMISPLRCGVNGVYVRVRCRQVGKIHPVIITQQQAPTWSLRNTESGTQGCRYAT